MHKIVCLTDVRMYICTYQYIIVHAQIKEYSINVCTSFSNLLLGDLEYSTVNCYTLTKHKGLHSIHTYVCIRTHVLITPREDNATIFPALLDLIVMH